jgi:hypothetical protein
MLQRSWKQEKYIKTYIHYQEFPLADESKNPHQQKQLAWNRLKTEARNKDAHEATKIILFINENLVSIRKINSRVDDKLEKIDIELNQTALDANLRQTTIMTLIDYVRFHICGV